jgi:hypothetical protein
MRSLFVAVVLACFVVAACDSGTPVPRHSCTTNAQCTAPQVCINSVCTTQGDAGHLDGSSGDGGAVDGHVRNLVSVAVMPAMATLNAVDGAMPTQAFMVVATYDDGSTSPLPNGVWSSTAPVVGTINRTTGLYTAGGVVAGRSTITVMINGMMATGTVDVNVTRTVVDTGTPADAATHFAAGVTTMNDPAQAATLLYPLDHARMPENVYPADIQWSGGAMNDIYQVRMDAPGVTVRAYVLNSGGGFGFHWASTRDAWRALAESAPDMDVTIAVDRWDSSSNTVFTGTARTIQFANASIRGAIYYWDLGQGRIQRINGDGSGRVNFMPNPPADPSSPGNQCVACHAISRDGRRMAAELWGGNSPSAIFDLTGDTTASPPPMIVQPGVTTFLSASFSADNSRLVGNVGNSLFLIDGNTGATIPSTLPTASSANPAWSPDNMHIAYVTNTNMGWGVDFTTGDLAIIDVLGGDQFSAPVQILGATSTGGPPVIARPSWSPDSHLIAFQHGVHSRSFQDNPTPGGPPIFQPARVEMVTRDGNLSYSMDALNGGDSNSFYPTFSPFDAGGYFWLAFFSTRDYGNAQVGTAGSGRRQLWVAAVSDAPNGGVDPSSVPYWLPQQNVADQNMAAFWTQEACHMDGLSCAVSGDCCSGFCRDTGHGPTCVPPTMVMCSMVGEACSTTSDCCTTDMSVCNANRCMVVM